MSLLIRIFGNVQGVFFRATTKKMADKLGVAGWVRNTPDGYVEIHAEGSKQSIEKLEEWCHEGPPNAVVKHVEVIEAEDEGCEGFEIRY